MFQIYNINSNNYIQWVLSWLWSNLILLSPAKYLSQLSWIPLPEIFFLSHVPLFAVHGFWLLKGIRKTLIDRASLPNLWSKIFFLNFPFFQGESKWQTKLPFTIVWKLKLIDFDIYNPSLKTNSDKITAKDLISFCRWVCIVMRWSFLYLAQ